MVLPVARCFERAAKYAGVADPVQNAQVAESIGVLLVQINVEHRKKKMPASMLYTHCFAISLHRMEVTDCAMPRITMNM